MRLLGEIFGALAIGVFCAVYFHERGWKRGQSAGLDRGLKEGYEAGKMHADNFWIHAEEAVKQERQKIWKEGWP